MKFSIIGSLLFSSWSMAAAAQEPPLISLAVGCYAWVQPPEASPNRPVPPAKFQLQTATRRESNGTWRRAWPPVINAASGWPQLYRSIPPLWRPISGDSVQLFWTTGTASVEVRALVESERLSGQARTVGATVPWIASYSATKRTPVSARRIDCDSLPQGDAPPRSDTVAALLAVADVITEKAAGRIGVWGRFSCGNRYDCEPAIGSSSQYWSMAGGDAFMQMLADSAKLSLLSPDEQFAGGFDSTVRISPPVFQGDLAALHLRFTHPDHYVGYGVLLRRTALGWRVEKVVMEVIS